MSNLLELENICFNYPGRGLTLDHLNFHLDAGEKVGLIGPNGAGKTTMLHILMGLMEPTSGEIRLFGQPMKSRKDFEEARLRIGFVFQNADDQLFCPTVLDDVAFGPLNQGLSEDEARERAMEALESVGLAGFEGRPSYRLSGGEKKLVSLATILSMRPEVLILDEPTTGLAPEAKERLAEILQTLDLPRLVVSHEPDFLASVTERILILRNGQVLKSEPKPHTHIHVHEVGDVPHAHD